MADYWGHWLEVGKSLPSPPKLFRVNWFRTGDNGKFLWPGFGDNLRVLQWILERCESRGEATDTVIGFVPTVGAINRKGLDLSDDAMTQLLRVDLPEWLDAVQGQATYLESFGSRLPEGIRQEHEGLARRISDATIPADVRGRDVGY
jgi:phosphoenolpyruvate carboxykinase (GTP)